MRLILGVRDDLKGSIVTKAVFFSRANAGFQLGGTGPNGLQGNNLLMTVMIGLGVISFLQIVTNIITPFIGKKDDTASAVATNTTATNSTTNSTRIKGSRSMPELLDLTDHVLSAIESLGEKMKKD